MSFRVYNLHTAAFAVARGAPFPEIQMNNGKSRAVFVFTDDGQVAADVQEFIDGNCSDDSCQVGAHRLIQSLRLLRDAVDEERGKL